MAVDRISMLPDEVLYHILSFLPTQMAAKTSILSKRWKPLWLLVPTLFWDDRSYLRNYKPYHYFTKFIYATILARDVPITTFRLQCEASNTDFSVSDLQIWVNAAIQRGLENLYIRLPHNENQLSWNSCIFGCKTLVVLKLAGLDLDVISFAHLPSLKTLHLFDVTFLEPLYLVSFADLPSLKTLDLRDVDFPEPQCLVDLLAGCPNLEYMRLRDIFYDDVDAIVHYKNFKSLSKLVRADIHSVLFDIFVESPKFDKYLDDILLFPNLTHVELMFGLWMSWDFVLAMLKHSPMLQYVVLSMQIQNGFYQYPVWISPCFAPECLSSQLRKCSIINYAGRESELHFAKYIMQNSKVLRTMTVCTLRYSELKVEDKFELLKELSLCPRSSSICELSFT